MVSCPTCANEVLVPAEDEEDADPQAGTSAPEPPAPGGLFDRDDFDALLNAGPSLEVSRPAPGAGNASRPPGGGRSGAVSSPAPAQPKGNPASAPPPYGATYGLDRWAAPPPAPAQPAPEPWQAELMPPPGLMLSPTLTTVLTVVVVVMVAIAFGVGVLVGRSWS